jgi:hypothetical protein
MYLAVFSTFAASKAEQLAAMLTRVHGAFLAAGLGEPLVSFTLTDSPLIANAEIVQAIGDFKRVSSVARVLKRIPEFERFARRGPPRADGESPIRALTNLSPDGAIEPVAFAILARIAEGVPKSFPFHAARFHFSAPGFSDGPEVPPFQDRAAIGMLMRAGVDIGAGQPTTPGIGVQDSWWVNGRQRGVGALRIVEADPAAKKLPAPPAPVAALFAACGKVRKTVQVPIAARAAAPDAPPAAPVDLKATPTGEALLAALRAHRAGLAELAKTLPHDVPAKIEDSAALNPHPPSGPKKPELERCFAPLGYRCRGESGTFTLRRSTKGNLSVELDLDVGSWSNSLSASFKVAGMIDGKGFKVAMSLPPAPRAAIGVVRGVEMVGQFPIGGPERWRQLVENLAALVSVLDARFVPEIEAIAGPSPEWYRPDAVAGG